MLEFSEDEFFSMDAHRKKFAASLSFVLPQLRQDQFLKQLDELVRNCETVHDPDDASEAGNIIDAFESWFHERGSVANADEMIKGRWWQNDDTGVIYFRREALLEYFRRHKDIKTVGPHKIFRLLAKRFDVQEDRLVIKGIRRRVWKMMNFEFENKEPLKTPDVKKIAKEEKL